MPSLVDRVSHAALLTIGARSRYVETSFGRIHTYEWRGAGEGTFVLLHGLGNTAAAYAAVLRHLRRFAARILMPDLPGHGRSDSLTGGLGRAALTVGTGEALDALIKPEAPAVVLGTSLGGGVALHYALERPERMHALVLVSPAGAPLSPEDLAELRVRFHLTSRADARRFLSELLHSPSWYMRALEPAILDRVGRPLVQDFLASLDAGEFLPSGKLASLTVPTTLLWGKSDRILPRSALEFYRLALPKGTTVEELDAVGHSPHFERPALIAEKLLAAYRSTL